MSPDLAPRRVLLSGTVAGAASVVAFAAIHQLLISDIWYSLLPMMAAGAVCGLCVAWSYGRLFRRASAASWLMYNLLYVALLVLLGVASLIVYEPVATIPALIAANEPPRELIREAMSLTVAFTLLSAALIGLLWGRNLLDHAAILLTCTVVVVLLGLNVSVLGLVHLTRGTFHLLAETFGLILAINLSYAAFFVVLERKLFFGVELAGRTHDKTNAAHAPARAGFVPDTIEPSGGRQ